MYKIIISKSYYYCNESYKSLKRIKKFIFPPPNVVIFLFIDVVEKNVLPHLELNRLWAYTLGPQLFLCAYQHISMFLPTQLSSED